jgi:hypothetical protein
VVRVLASVVERDAAALGLGDVRGAAFLDPFERALRSAGLDVTHRREATVADVVDLGSSWAKRLGIPERRPAWILTARRGRY